MLRIGFIGAGCVNFGGPDGPWDHATRLEKMPNIQFVGISDPNVERCKSVLSQRQSRAEFKQLWENCQIFADYSQMLSEVKPHAVFIGVPPSCHGSSKVPMELKCVEAGVHCFVEKPLSNATAEDTLNFAKQVQDHPSKAIVSVGYMFRHTKWVKYMLQLIKDHGKPIVAFNGQYNCAYVLVASPFWWDKQFSGGPIVEQATHFVDLARYIVGEVDDKTLQGWCVPASQQKNTVGNLEAIPKSVDESKIPAERQIARSTVVNWRYKSGAIGTLLHAALLQSSAYDARLEILADGLRIRVEEPYSKKPRLHILRGNASVEEVVEFPDDDPYYTEIEEFINGVRQKVANPNANPAVTCDLVDGSKTYALTCKITEIAKPQ